MKFAYSNKRLYINLILGIAWLGVGISYFIEQNEKLLYKPYALSLLGILYILIFLYDYTQKYFEVRKNKIKINSVFGKEIIFNDLKEVKYFDDVYTFKTRNNTFKILKSQINKNQIAEFEIFFSNLNNDLKNNAV